MFDIQHYNEIILPCQSVIKNNSKIFLKYNNTLQITLLLYKITIQKTLDMYEIEYLYKFHYKIPQKVLYMAKN